MSGLIIAQRFKSGDLEHDPLGRGEMAGSSSTKIGSLLLSSRLSFTQSVAYNAADSTDKAEIQCPWFTSALAG